jgi:very-short-patch-repair endonuclease
MKKKHKNSRKKVNSFNSFEKMENKNDMVNKYLDKSELKVGNTKNKYQSIGEKKLEIILSSINIDFIREYEFFDCINPLTRNRLRFDFYIPKHNMLIEFDGRQHHSLLNNQSGNDFNKQIYRDSIKNKYCIDNNIKLVRFKSSDYSDLENKVNKIINEA